MSKLLHVLTRGGLAPVGAAAIAICGCAGADEPADPSDRSAYLFDLTDDDVVQLHDEYLADEDVEVTRSRLTAPFDCTLFDDLCEQVGEAEAIAITGALVDMAREGEDAATIDAQLSEWLLEGMRALPEPSADELTFRSSSSWVYTLVSGSRRLGVRKGITTPVFGMRRAWTQAEFVNTSFNRRRAATLCVNPGTNTQVHTVYTSSTGPIDTTIESLNPGTTCVGNARTHEAQTLHARNSGSEGSGIQWWFTVTSRGSASASNNGRAYNVTGLDHGRTYY